MGLAAALLVALTGCGNHSSPGPQLVPLGDPGSHNVAIGLGKIKPGAEASFGSMIVCLDRDGQVTIDGVKPVDPEGGIRVDQFGVRPSPYPKHEPSIGAYKGDLEHNGFKAGRQVNVTCDMKTGRGYELAVAVSMPDSAQARMSGVEVLYTSAGQRESVTYPITVFLCPGIIHGSRSCAQGDDA